jgi:hypothetical protein
MFLTFDFIVSLVNSLIPVSSMFADSVTCSSVLTISTQ